MNYLDAIKASVITCLQKYADFKGRAGRPEFWWFILATIVGSLVLSMVSVLLSNVFSLALLVPTLAVGARRLHDTGKSGWWQLVLLVPLVGIAVMIYLQAQPGQPEANAHGEMPDAPSTVA